MPTIAGEELAIYPDDSEAKNVEVDITAKLGELALQHRGTGSNCSL